MSVTSLVESPKATKKTLEKPKAEKKRVRFHGRVKRRFYDRVEEEDRDNVWYTSEHYSQARKFEDALRDCVSENKDLYRKNKENLNAQGVMTHDQAQKKYDKVDAAIDAVLAEQDDQESDFYDNNSSDELFTLNDEKIAEIYRRYAYEALEQAQCRANRHARHMQEADEDSEEINPSRFMRKESPARLSPRSKKSIMVFSSKPSVFVTEKSSRTVRCTA